MNKLVEIMTVPAVRRRFAHRLDSLRAVGIADSRHTTASPLRSLNCDDDQAAAHESFPVRGGPKQQTSLPRLSA